MAENQTKTTSSKKNIERTAQNPVQHEKATVHVSLDSKTTPKRCQGEDASPKDLKGLQALANNKLKRKKKLSSSLTSVGDTVNQEKRTRIEGFQLLCRGKLQAKDIKSFEDVKAPVTQLTMSSLKFDREREKKRPVNIEKVTTTDPPQRLRRKLQEHLGTIQKLNALTEQLRIEVNELKACLTTERAAVRTLRAQHDADSRRWKNEVKKVQHSLDIAKKSNGIKKLFESGSESGGIFATADGLRNNEIKKLKTEVAVLHEESQINEEYQIMGPNDSRSRKDVELSKNACDYLFIQLQKSAKTEIIRLLEEIKTKDRKIDQLKKNLLASQNPMKQKKNDSQLPTTTKYKTNPIETSQRREKPPTNLTKTEEKQQTQLKNIELNKTEENYNKLAPQMSTKMSQLNGLKKIRALDGMDATTWITTTKELNSDTDSAVSSAPPSISPQPPSSGSDSGVIWQTLQDLDKLQKEAEMYQKENDRLQLEVLMLKRELEGAQKTAFTAIKSQTQIDEQKQCIQQLKEHQTQLTDECRELCEQNELLEFRILELEGESNKMEISCEEHCQNLKILIEQSSQNLEDRDKQCLQILMHFLQTLDLDKIKYGFQTRKEALRNQNQKHSAGYPPNQRIVATVQPYNNCLTSIAPPTPIKESSCQSRCLSESGVFVEYDFSSPSLAPSNPTTHPHLQFYQQRLEQLEAKLQIYESSGDTQARHLAQRLQREVQLEKDLKELSHRVALLAEENAQLEESKCEFEEAENDTRLYLQRNEVELEILRQRNVELELGKESLSAKVQDCEKEVVIFRQALATAEIQLEQLLAERKHAQKELYYFRRSLPLLLIYRLLALTKMGNSVSSPEQIYRPSSGQDAATEKVTKSKMHKMEFSMGQGLSDATDGRDVVYFKEEVKNLRVQLKELNARYYEAMETADSHWVDLEQQYKDREDAYRAKETNLKQKITQLQDCLRDDSRAASEKIQQLEEVEQGLKTCLVRLTKEHRDLLAENRSLQSSMENVMAKMEVDTDIKQPLTEALESEKKRSKALMDDLTFAKKMQQSTEDQLRQETDSLRVQIFHLKKEFMHIEVTNGELKEEVGTLENKIRQMAMQLKDAEERAQCLEDELRSKDEQCQLLERKLGVIPDGFSLADELYDSPVKRAKMGEIPDLQTASLGLGAALMDIERRERELPTHKDFQAIACSVKQLADTLLSQSPSEVSLIKSQNGSEQNDKILATPIGCEERASGGLVVMSGASKASEGSKKTSFTSVKRSSSIRQNVFKEPKVGGTARRSRSRLDSRTNLQVLSISDDRDDNICKVPSTLRHLIYGNAHLEREVERQKRNNKKRKSTPEWDLRNSSFSVGSRRLMLHRFIYRRLQRARMRLGSAKRAPGRKLQLSLSCNSFHSAASVHTVHSARSGISLHSQHASVLNVEWEQLASASFSQTDRSDCLEESVQVSPNSSEQEVQVHPESIDCASQADVGVEQRLLLMPLKTRCFVDLIQSAVSDYLDVAAFRKRLLQLWEGDENFREHIELLPDLWTDRQFPGALDSYEGFEAALNCIRSLKIALMPGSSALLEKIKQRIDARLVQYHNRKMESEFCCTIYYPVERRNSLSFSGPFS